jgi:hypothetical protein
LGRPDLVERYFMPVYEQQVRALHAQGKRMAVHMDGRLGAPMGLIARTPVDIVEALHPPPMGDLGGVPRLGVPGRACHDEGVRAGPAAGSGQRRADRDRDIHREPGVQRESAAAGRESVELEVDSRYEQAGMTESGIHRPGEGGFPLRASGNDGIGHPHRTLPGAISLLGPSLV